MTAVGRFWIKMSGPAVPAGPDVYGLRVIKNNWGALVEKRFISQEDVLLPPELWDIGRLVANEVPDAKSVRHWIRDFLKEQYFIPVVVASDGWIIDGHHRWEAMKILGYGQIWVQRAVLKRDEQARP